MDKWKRSVIPLNEHVHKEIIQPIEEGEAMPKIIENARIELLAEARRQIAGCG